MPGKTLRVGIIGIGWWALTRHAPRLRETGKAEIVAISRRNAQALVLMQRRVSVWRGRTQTGDDARAILTWRL